MVHSSYARLVEKIQRVEDENKNLVKIVEKLKCENEKVSNKFIFLTLFYYFLKYLKQLLRNKTKI